VQVQAVCVAQRDVLVGEVLPAAPDDAYESQLGQKQLKLQLQLLLPTSLLTQVGGWGKGLVERRGYTGLCVCGGVEHSLRLSGPGCRRPASSTA